MCILECVGNQVSTIRDYAGRYLIGLQDGTMKAQTATRSIQSQFQIVKIDDKVAFRNILGKFLAAEPDLTLKWNRGTAGNWEKYVMEQHGDKTAFKTDHNDYLSVNDEGSFIRVPDVGPNEMFEIIDMCKKGNSAFINILIM